MFNRGNVIVKYILYFIFYIVTYHISLVGHIHSSQQLILPQFLSLLQEKCLIDVEGTISQASSLYNSARHSLEVSV